MATIIEFARSKEREAEQMQRELVAKGASNEGAQRASAEIIDIADHIRKSVSEAKTHTGFDPGSGQITNLPGDTVGRIDKRSLKTEFDEKMIESGNKTIIRQAIIHESEHAQNAIADHQKVGIINPDYEEALTETATSRVTAVVMAYKQHMHIIADVTAATGVSEDGQLKLYEDGENAQLNALLDQTYNKVVNIFASKKANAAQSMKQPPSLAA